MKYALSVVVSLLLSLSLMSTADARTLEQIKRAGVIRVAADGMTPPFNYYKNGKELVGFEVDLANELAKRLGVKVQWVVQPFNTLLVGIAQDRFDLIATSFAVTPARQEAVDFVAPHYCTGAIIVSKPTGCHRAIAGDAPESHAVRRANELTRPRDDE